MKKEIAQDMLAEMGYSIKRYELYDDRGEYVTSFRWGWSEGAAPRLFFYPIFHSDMKSRSCEEAALKFLTTCFDEEPDEANNDDAARWLDNATSERVHDAVRAEKRFLGLVY